MVGLPLLEFFGFLFRDCEVFFLLEGRRDADWRMNRLAWAELYMTVAMLAAHFDFEFVGTTAKDVDPFSDQFIFGTESKYGVRVRASRCET